MLHGLCRCLANLSEKVPIAATLVTLLHFDCVVFRPGGKLTVGLDSNKVNKNRKRGGETRIIASDVLTWCVQK